MKKKKIIFIWLLLCIFLLSFIIYKKVSNFTKETQNDQWIIQEIKIKNDYKIINDFSEWTFWCSKSDLYYINDEKKYNIIKSFYDNDWGLVCSFDIKYFDENNVDVYFCYAQGAWSWECYYALMRYDLIKNKFKYIKSWFNLDLMFDKAFSYRFWFYYGSLFKKTDFNFFGLYNYIPEDKSKYTKEFLDRFLNYLEENNLLIK